MSSAHRDQDFTAYVAVSAPGLRRVAFLVCGDWQRAEDAVQTALVRLYLAWDRVNTRQSLDAFVRTTLLRALIDEGRRPWRREWVHAALPDTPISPDESVEDRLLLQAALLQVPRRQRAVLALRFYQGCDVAQVARLLGCSEGTVKSQTARGLARLRELLAVAGPALSDCREG